MSIFEYHDSYMNFQPFIFHFDRVEHNSHCISPAHYNWHSNIEILYFTNGAGYVHCNDEQIAVSKGDIFIINSNHSHAFSSDSSMEYYCLIPDGDFCFNNGINPLSIYFTPFIQDEKLCEIFREFIEIYYSADMYRDAMLRASLLNMLIYLAKNYGALHEDSSFTPNIAKGIQSAVGYIKCHLSEKITVEQLAESVNISKYHFLRNFKKLTGDTPIVFINKMRCESAKKLLASGSYPISRVCEKCGFENMSYFAKVFKNYTGQTPTDFLKSGV